MDNAVLTDLGLLLVGAVYFLVYKLVVAKRFKVKMIHSLWIPLVYAIGYSIFVVSLLQTPWFGANRSLWSSLWVVLEVNLPVVAYLILFGLFALLEKKPAN